ncbi:hypothetical protein NA78x_000184 [Anatilimnocola sp. NA78]|uniref:hypothetical protein n=1 Tax=Anatilimnocola sp. NA78 TaxID=3415683 RepID=UPI003CE56457
MRYYEAYIQRVTLREFIRIAYPNTFSALFTWLWIQLGVVRWTPQICPREEWEIDAPVRLDDCEEPVRSSLTDAAHQAEADGFIEPIVFHYRSMGFNNLPMVTGCLRARHAQGNAILQAIHTAPVGIAGMCCLQVVSFLSDGRAIATANNRRTFNSAPGLEATFLPGAKLNVLVAAHEQKLRSSAARVVSLRNNADMVRELEQLSERFFAHMTARGIMREVRNPVTG